MKIKDSIKILKLPSMHLGIYFTIIMTLFIFVIAGAFTLYMVFAFKNLASEYETEIHKLKYSITTMFLQTVEQDAKINNFAHTRILANSLKDDNLISGFYIKNNKTNKLVLGDTDIILQNTDNTARYVGDYSIFYEASRDDVVISPIDMGNLVANIILLFCLIGLVGSFLLSDFISNPLKKLSKAAKEIADGKFDAKIEKTIFNEMNDLISSYNNMSQQLNELYSSLELKVQERTLALEEANHKLQETQAMMVHSEKMRSLGELVAGIAHEINNPVNFIHGNIMILQNYSDDLLKLIDLYEQNSISFPVDIKAKIEQLKENIDLNFLKTDIKDLIKSCIEGTERTRNIVLDLKNFSRMEEMVLTQFDIPKEIDTTLNILNNKYKNRITVIKNYDENLPKIEAYGGQINQVFMNILDNAQDAIKGTGTLIINALKENENIRIEFIDSGEGIPENNLKKIFDPFFTTKTVGKGTGLGMSISYRVIKDHNGTIDVESKLGKGTKFTIVLPINHVNTDKE